MVRRHKARFPCRIPIGHEVYSESATVDAHGNEVEDWADAVEVKVFGWEPPKSTEPAVAGHDRVIVDILLYAPRSMNVGPHDRVILAGKRYEVIGDPGDPNNNPWFVPGLVTINLKRVEG